jgi:peptide deformylase
MILPVYVYGQPVLRKKAQDIEKGEEGLEELIGNLFETMYHADGVGLAGPQVGISKSIFIVDATPMEDDDPELKGFKKVFINPEIHDETGEKWAYNEGCLSLPTIREDVERLSDVTVSYYDENFEFHKEKYTGIKARIIQHEYDHLQGKLFIDLLNPLRKKLLAKKLKAVSQGKVDIAYKIKIAKK